MCGDCAREEGAEVDPAAEATAVAAVRAAGVAAHPRPCTDPRCTCVTEARRAVVVRVERRRYTQDAGWCDRDQTDLETFFGKALPPAAGDHSAFGAMCARYGEATNPVTKREHERHLYAVTRPRHITVIRGGVVRVTHEPEVLESEVVGIGAAGHAGKFDSWGDTMAAYIDARARLRFVWAALSRVPRWAFDTLEARYAMGSERSSKTFGLLGGVAMLTATAAHVRDVRASEGENESVRETVERLTRLTHDTTVAASARSGATTAIERIRREADALLRGAQALYVERARGAAA